MTRSMLLVLGICWAEINGRMLVGATTGRTPMGSREKVEHSPTPSRFTQLTTHNPSPSTDGTVAMIVRGEGERCCSVSDTECSPRKLTAVADRGIGGAGGEAACVGLGAGDACSAQQRHLRRASSSGRGVSIACRRYRDERHLTPPVFRLRGGEVPKKHEAGSRWNMNLFGWSSGSESVAKEREAVRARRRREMEEAEAREVLRHGREDRLEMELEKEASESEDRLDGGGILEPFVPGGIARHRSSGGADRLWLDAVEGVVGGMVLAMVSLRPLWHTFRGMFGLSLLFYGEEFATLAFHIIVFRLSGWKKAAKSKNELVAYYLKARQAMIKAAKDVRASAALMAKKDRMLARKEEMMAEKKKLLKMGHVTPAEARAFIDKYRRDIEIIAREQEVLATASSSVLAIKGALSLKKLAASVNGLYSAVITSITASTFKRAGQLTLALTCGGLIKKTLFDLLGPVIDPIGYQIELESYVAKIMRGPANLYVGIVGYVGAALMFFHFFVDPHKALMITFVLLGARVVTDYVVAALNPVRWRFGMSKKIDNMPLSAVIYLSVATMGFVFHGDAGVVGDYVCRPFIAFLGILNNLLNRFQISTISYFT